MEQGRTFVLNISGISKLEGGVCVYVCACGGGVCAHTDGQETPKDNGLHTVT